MDFSAWIVLLSSISHEKSLLNSEKSYLLLLHKWRSIFCSVQHLSNSSHVDHHFLLKSSYYWIEVLLSNILNSCILCLLIVAKPCLRLFILARYTMVHLVSLAKVRYSCQSRQKYNVFLSYQTNAQTCHIKRLYTILAITACYFKK